MASGGTITVDCSQVNEAIDYLKSLTGVRCVELNCKHNMANDPVNHTAACRMKQIYITKGGKCEQFEPTSETTSTK